MYIHYVFTYLRIISAKEQHKFYLNPINGDTRGDASETLIYDAL